MMLDGEIGVVGLLLGGRRCQGELHEKQDWSSLIMSAILRHTRKFASLPAVITPI